jgi:hypothetical protein
MRRYGLIRPDSEAVMLDGILETWTRSSVREKGFSLTFDWVNALDFAVRNRCGETIEVFFSLLDGVRRTVGFSELPDHDRQPVETAYAWASQLVEAHNPSVVGVRFDPCWFREARVSFFTDRARFDTLTKHAAARVYEGYAGCYDPNKAYQRRGDELPSICDIPSGAIASLTELRWNNQLDAVLERVQSHQS